MMMKKSNGIPQLGLGTYPLQGDDVYKAVRMAIDLGYRHIDTAQMYGNEFDVGRAIKDCGVKRDELYIVTKVDPGNISQQRFTKTVQKSIADLGGPVDLLLIHWPPADDALDGALDLLLAEFEKSHTKNIGVSNFSSKMMRHAQAYTNGKIICNQVEFHPLLDQSRLLAAATELGMVLEAYSPIARGAALKPEIIQDIATRLNRPPSEIVLRWITQQGVVAIPMTTKKENAASNLRALDFDLSSADMKAISAIGTADGRTINPGWMSGRWDPTT
jgi:2,5-diketo-D-gluconate reductase B